MQTTDELSPRQAAEVFTALRFWARATRYNAEDAERALLSACESRSNRNWVLGAATGALAGLAVGLQLKQPRVQTASLAAIASTFGSLYGQYRANAPCLCDLLALGEAQESPLAEQARHIMRVGGAQTISALTRQRRQQQLAENDGAHGGGGMVMFSEELETARALCDELEKRITVRKKWGQARDAIQTQSAIKTLLGAGRRATIDRGSPTAGGALLADPADAAKRVGFATPSRGSPGNRRASAPACSTPSSRRAWRRRLTT